jgi:RHS repeat-associated protein
LGQLSTVSKVRLLIAQSPNGSTTHEFYGGDTTSNLSLLGTLSGSTVNGQWLEFDPNTSNIRYLKVLTTSTPSSWVAWSEIEIYGSNSGTTNYVLTDAQGSARTVMSNNGSVIARHDYLPFGEEISSGLRGSGLGYGATDNNRQKYGLTERDDTTGLDHTWWRKYENLSGRWTSPDPLSGSIGDPQSFNGYNYTGNDPVNFIDPSGLSEESPLSLARRVMKPVVDNSTPWIVNVPPEPNSPLGTSYPDWLIVAVVNPGDLNGGGGPQNPTPFDRLLDRARQLHNQPNRNDCLALVDLIRTSAKLFPNVISATSALGDVLTGSSSAYELAIRNAANDMSNPMVTFGNNGFQTSFAGDPGDNQVRHFMGGLLVGATLGAANGLPRMNARENPNIPGDVADINLNGVSVPLGDLILGPFSRLPNHNLIDQAPVM